MTRIELLRIMDRMGRLWPQSGLSDAAKVAPRTIDVWLELWAELDAGSAKRAVDSLAADGERHAPAPGMVLRRAQELAASSGLDALPEHARREPTPEERDAARRRLPEVRAAIAAAARGWSPEAPQ